LDRRRSEIVGHSPTRFHIVMSATRDIGVPASLSQQAPAVLAMGPFGATPEDEGLEAEIRRFRLPLEAIGRLVDGPAQIRARDPHVGKVVIPVGAVRYESPH